VLDALSLSRSKSGNEGAALVAGHRAVRGALRCHSGTHSRFHVGIGARKKARGATPCPRTGQSRRAPEPASNRLSFYYFRMLAEVLLLEAPCESGRCESSLGPLRSPLHVLGPGHMTTRELLSGPTGPGSGSRPLPSDREVDFCQEPRLGMSSRQGVIVPGSYTGDSVAGPGHPLKARKVPGLGYPMVPQTSPPVSSDTDTLGIRHSRKLEGGRE
jgi:hypothetical protein